MKATPGQVRRCLGVAIGCLPIGGLLFPLAAQADQDESLVGLTDLAVVVRVDSQAVGKGLRADDLQLDALRALRQGGIVSDTVSTATGGILSIEVRLSRPELDELYAFFISVELLQHATPIRFIARCVREELDAPTCLRTMIETGEPAVTWRQGTVGLVGGNVLWQLRDEVAGSVRQFFDAYARANPDGVGEP